MKSTVIAMLITPLLCALPCRSQQIRILVLDARHGKPVSNECLNISLGTWHGADLFAPTNKDGVVTLSFSSDHVSVEPVVSKACGAMSSTKSFPIAKAQESIAILPNYNVSCQYSKEQTKNPGWLHNPLYQSVIPSFMLRDILLNGVVAANTCSHLKPTPVPGELVLIVRKVTFMEGMRS
ncbi:MAG TPA: hypothetical protein VIJ65_11565 [Acidobacteriaceae bacterium]